MPFLQAYDTELLFLLFGSVSAFFMALLRCLSFDRRNAVMIITEAFMCTMITLSIAIGAKTTWNVSYSWSVPVGVFIGFIGTNLVHAVIKRVLEYHVTKYTDDRSDGPAGPGVNGALSQSKSAPPQRENP